MGNTRKPQALDDDALAEVIGGADLSFGGSLDVVVDDTSTPVLSSLAGQAGSTGGGEEGSEGTVELDARLKRFFS
jgi:hypothetical protein